MTQKPSKRILVKAAMLGLACAALACSSGCRKAGHYRTFVSEGKEFSCEIPADWEIRRSRGDALAIDSPDAIETASAHIHISRQSKPRTIEAIKEFSEWYKKRHAGDSENRLDPLETIHFSSFTGLKYSSTFINVMAGMLTAEMRGKEGIKTNKPLPKPVLEKNTDVYFDTPDGQYHISYMAPIAVYGDTPFKVDITSKTPSDMYEKHRPEFEHMLNTFRWIKKAKPAK